MITRRSCSKDWCHEHREMNWAVNCGSLFLLNNLDYWGKKDETSGWMWGKNTLKFRNKMSGAQLYLTRQTVSLMGSTGTALVGNSLDSDTIRERNEKKKGYWTASQARILKKQPFYQVWGLVSTYLLISHTELERVAYFLTYKTFNFPLITPILSSYNKAGAAVHSHKRDPKADYNAKQAG